MKKGQNCRFGCVLDNAGPDGIIPLIHFRYPERIRKYHGDNGMQSRLTKYLSCAR